MLTKDKLLHCLARLGDELAKQGLDARLYPIQPKEASASGTSRPPKRWTAYTPSSRKRKIWQAIDQPARLCDLRFLKKHSSLYSSADNFRQS